MKLKLVDDWKTWPRRWSVWLGTMGSALVTLLIAWPDAAITAWNLLPADLRALIPPKYTPLIGVGIFVLSMFAQMIKQQKLQPPGVSNDPANRP